MHNILWMEYLPAFGHLVTNHQNQDSPLWRGWRAVRQRTGEFFYHGFCGLDGSFPMRDCEQDKNPINPLERMEGGTPEDRGVLTTDRTDKSCGGRNGSKSLLLSPGLRPCSPMRMLSHESKLPCLSIHIRLVCPLADKESHKTKKLPLAVQNEPPSEATDSYLKPMRSLSCGVLPSRQMFGGVS